LGWSPVAPSMRHTERVVELPVGAFSVLQPGCNPHDKNSCVETYFQVGAESFELMATLDLLGYIMWEPCFDYLRTKEQLGYSVSCGVKNNNGVLGYGVQVISANYAPAVVQAKIEEFLGAFREQLRSMPAGVRIEY
jgi:secreted Zn-dependent insulinase-like peptidase